MKVKVNTVQRAKTVFVDEIASVDINLSKLQAEFLATILNNIGGNPSRTYRKIADDIREALASAGIYKNEEISAKIDDEYRAIYFV